MSETIVDEIAVFFGFDPDPRAHPAAVQLQQTLVSLGRWASAAAAMVTASAASLVYFAERSANTGAGIERFHQLTGMSTQAVQQWTYAVQIMGGHKESMLRDIGVLSLVLHPLVRGQFNPALFSVFGPRIESIRGVDQLLRELNRFFSTMTSDQALRWGNLLGISDETVLVLRQDARSLEALLEVGKKRALTDDETERALKFAQTWDDMKDRFVRFTRRIAIRLLPLMDRLIAATLRWWEDCGKTVSDALNRGISGVVDGFSRFCDELERLRGLGSLVGNVFSMMTDPATVSKITGAALTGIALVFGVLLGKYLVLGALVLGMLAAGEDLAATIAGEDEDTLTRRMLVWFHGHVPTWMWLGQAPKNRAQAQQKSLLLGGASLIAEELVRAWGTGNAEAYPIQSTRAYDQNVRLYVHNAEDPTEVAREIATRLRIRSGSAEAELPPVVMESLIQRASRRYGVPASLIKAVIKAESGFKPKAVSRTGARGLMQLMPGTARILGVNDSFDPEQNVMGGTRYLRDLITRYHGDVDRAVAAYNWGPSRVDRNGTNNMPSETRQYLANVRRYQAEYGAR
jgi:soluble lytic murein transglycosylase-like protein